MHDDVSRLLMELLGNLTYASKKITDVLQAMHKGQECCAAPAAAPAAADEAIANALDRIQQFEPGPAAMEAAEAAPKKKRGRRGKFKITEAELKKLYVEDGLTAKKIAEKFGAKPGTVAQRVMKLGLSKRGPSPMKGKKAKKK